VDALLVNGSDTSACQVRILLLKLVHCLIGIESSWFAIGISIFSVEIAGSMVIRVPVNNGSETGFGSLNRSINQRKLSNVVLINHA